ncbi:lipocalin family protein [Primorskyibacter marinus]|uniref:lipocalin family protein n=1 Tax=Primorskyibacter marinus TaxID=1977320 RepID=UPI0013004594|nr:lipocalin family protein [Primorskyibacter marinus]
MALLLSGCVGARSEKPADGYRDTLVAISSSTRFDPQSFAGEWTRLAAFGSPYTDAGCGTLRFTPLPDNEMAVQICGGGAGAAMQYAIASFGRLEAEGVDPVWVLWVAEDFGTAVLGTPSGSFGWIVNRGPRIQPDRYQAATDLLEFNGYDTSRLKRRQ